MSHCLSPLRAPTYLFPREKTAVPGRTPSPRDRTLPIANDGIGIVIGIGVASRRRPRTTAAPGWRMTKFSRQTADRAADRRRPPEDGKSWTCAERAVSSLNSLVAGEGLLFGLRSRLCTRSERRPTPLYRPARGCNRSLPQAVHANQHTSPNISRIDLDQTLVREQFCWDVKQQITKATTMGEQSRYLAVRSEFYWTTKSKVFVLSTK